MTNEAKKLPYAILLLAALSAITVGGVLFFSILSTNYSQKLTNAPSPITNDDNDLKADGKIVLLFWSKLRGKPAKRAEGLLEKGNKRGQCPVACEVTSNRERIKEAHALIVHARDPYPLPPTKDVPWILTTLENPVYTPVLRNPKYMSQFHLLRSYRLDSDYPAPLFKKPNLDPPVPFKNKTGGIIAAFSNCERVRTEYLKQLMKYIPVDSYGGCLRNKLGIIERYGQDFKSIKTKLQRNYKFAITFFNQDCDYFVDDQILHALNAGAVPVVMSTDKIYEFLPGNLRNAIVNVRDFKTPKKLAEYLKFLMNNETEYKKHLEWKTKGFGRINDTVIGQYWDGKFNHWCRMCQAISEGRWHKEGLKADVCESRKYETWGIKPKH